MVTLNVYESVYVWGDCIWVFEYLRLFLGSFMGFRFGFMSVRVSQGVLRVFGGIYGGFFRGLTCGFKQINANLMNLLYSLNLVRFYNINNCSCFV